MFHILGDHLDSTSIVTNANGTKVSEIRYKAWGEIRYESGASPTDYTLRHAQGNAYTGQYSYTADFGLMFYNARWYDPSLGRFTQADTIIPQSQGVQAFDRYAYANNNPIHYIDPDGHCAVRPGFKCAANPRITTASVKSSATHTQSDTIILNPTHTDENGNTIIAVPIPQPNDSSSVPTITTISSSESYSFETVLFEKGPVDEGTLSYSLFDVEYEHTRDGETVFSTETGVEIRVHYVDELRIVNENTVFETTITVYDQNGDILDIRETTSNTNIRQMQVRFSESTKSSFHKWIPITNYAPNIVYR